MGFLTACALFLIVIYRTFHMPPPLPASAYDFETGQSAGAPSVPPPPPLAEGESHRKRSRPLARNGGQAEESAAESAVIREYATGDADPNPSAEPALASIEPVTASDRVPVFVVPPEHKQDSRGMRWIKAVGKALRIVPEKDAEEETFRATPDGGE